MVAAAGTCCVVHVPDCDRSLPAAPALEVDVKCRWKSREIFVTYEDVTAVSIIITAYQTARRHMLEERNFVRFYLLILCFCNSVVLRS